MHVLKIVVTAVQTVLGTILFAAAARADFLWGINGHPLNAYSGVTIEQQLDYVKDLGLKSYRVNVTDTGQIPKLRRIFDQAKVRGLSILPVITPPFDLAKETSGDLEKHSYDFAFTLVSAFKGEIAVWELGNELENFAIIKACERRDDGAIYNCSFGPAGGKSYLDYYGPRWEKVSATLKGLAAGSIAADPQIRRAIGTAGWGHTGAFERLKRDNIPWEISIWHQYGLDPEWALAILATYNRPIWITEFNHPLGSQKSATEQAIGLSAIIARLRQLRRAYNVEAAFIYQLMDETYWAPDFEAYMGLVQLTKTVDGLWQPGAAKPAYLAVQQAIAADVSRPVATIPPASRSSSPDPVTAPVEVVQHASPIDRNCALDDAADADRIDPEHIISYAYCLVLGRKADGLGMRAWTERLRADTTVATVLVELMHSDEFSQKYSVPAMSNADYVTFINRLLLNRPLEQMRRDAVVSDFESIPLSRADYQRRIIGSREFKSRHALLTKAIAPLASLPPPRLDGQKACAVKAQADAEDQPRSQINYSYCLILGRDADGFGMQSWKDALAKGLTIPALIEQLLASEEFQGKYAVSRLDNADFVTLLCRLLLNRDPAPAERESYVAELVSGSASRKDVYKRFIASDEFRAKQSPLFLAQGGSAAQASGTR